jgi:hypothetical protein
MTLRQNKKISELPSLSSTSLDTTYIVGVSGSTTYKILANQLTSSANINTGSLVTTSSFNQYTASVTASVPNGTISGSSQLTSSYDTRYETRGRGIVSGSLQLTSSFETVGRAIISGSSQITGVLAPSNLSTTGQVSASVFVGGYLVPEAKFTVVSSKAMTFWPNISTEAVRFTTGGGVLIGQNGGTNDYGLKLDVSGSTRFTGNMIITGSLLTSNGITGSIAATNGVISGSAQLPSGLISGSSQLTSSYDTRYALSASFVSSSNVLSIQTISSASYAALTPPISGTLYIIIG